MTFVFKGLPAARTWAVIDLDEGMDSTDATVLLIDDDCEVRDAMARLLRSAGWKTMQFACAQDFLAGPGFPGTGCIVLDIRMPGMSGPELHDWMVEHGVSIPVIYLSGHCDVPTSVQAMKRGAQDVLQKPADDDVLLHAITVAVQRHRQDRVRRDIDADIASRLDTLSTREREVIDHVIIGRLNKQIAADLGISEKTVKVHRGRAMAKMKVRSVAELVHLCDQLGIDPPSRPSGARAETSRHAPAARAGEAAWSRLDQGPIPLGSPPGYRPWKTRGPAPSAQLPTQRR
jgi:RNA polymerase sigma factor (sigma-70 family)